MSYQPLTEMKSPTLDEMEVKVEQVIAKIAQVTKQHKADVQVCVDCADGLLEVAQQVRTQASALICQIPKRALAWNPNLICFVYKTPMICIHFESDGQHTLLLIFVVRPC